MQVFKPPDLKYSNFWIDFNLGTGNLIIYCVKTPQSDAMWDTVIINSAIVVKMSVSPSGETNLHLKLANQVTNLFSSSPPSGDSAGNSVDIVLGHQPIIEKLLKTMYPGKL